MAQTAFTQALALSVYFNDAGEYCRKYVVRNAGGAILYQGREVPPSNWQKTKGLFGRAFRAAFDLPLLDAQGKHVAHATCPGWQSYRIHIRLSGSDATDWGHVHLRFLARQYMEQTLPDGHRGLSISPVILSLRNKLFRDGTCIGELEIPFVGNGPSWGGQIDHFKLYLLPDIAGEALVQVLIFLACPLMLDCMRRRRGP